LALLNVDRELDNAQWTSAKADLERILRIRPNFAVALEARGEAETALRDTTAALADFDRAVTLDPDELATRARRGQLYQSLGKTKQAAADFAFIYQAGQSIPRWAGVVAFVRRIDHSSAPTKVHKRPKRRHQTDADAAPPPAPEASPQTEPSPQT
jgi:tetratricopeptide (TPR) repeat protein